MSVPLATLRAEMIARFKDLPSTRDAALAMLKKVEDEIASLHDVEAYLHRVLGVAVEGDGATDLALPEAVDRILMEADGAWMRAAEIARRINAANMVGTRVATTATVTGVLRADYRETNPAKKRGWQRRQIAPRVVEWSCPAKVPTADRIALPR